MTVSPPSFGIRLECRGSNVLVTLTGELDLHTRAQLRNHFQWFIDDADGNVDLDLAGVTYIESIGIHAILSAQETLRERHRSLRVVRASPQVERLFELCGIAHLLEHSEQVAFAASPTAPSPFDA